MPGSEVANLVEQMAVDGAGGVAVGIAGVALRAGFHWLALLKFAAESLFHSALENAMADARLHGAMRMAAGAVGRAEGEREVRKGALTVIDSCINNLLAPSLRDSVTNL